MDHRGWDHRGYLPHFDQAHTQQFVTWRLNDALPQALVKRLELAWMYELDPGKKRRLHHQLEEALEGLWCLPSEAAGVREDSAGCAVALSSGTLRYAFLGRNAEPCARTLHSIRRFPFG